MFFVVAVLALIVLLAVAGKAETPPKWWEGVEIDLHALKAPSLEQKRWAKARGWEAAPKSALFRSGALLIGGVDAANKLAGSMGDEFIALPTGKMGDLTDKWIVGRADEDTLAEVRAKGTPNSVLKALGRCISPGIVPVEKLVLRAKCVRTVHDGHTYITGALAERIGKAYGINAKGYKVNGASMKALLLADDQAVVREYGFLDYREADMFIDMNCLKNVEVEEGEVIEIDFANITLHAIGEDTLSIGKKRLGFQVLSWLTMSEYDKLVGMATYTHKLADKVRNLLDAYFTTSPADFLAAVCEIFPEGETVSGDDGEEKVDGEAYYTLDTFVERCHLGYLPRFHNYLERNQIDAVVEACLRRLLSGLYVHGMHAWASSSSDLKPGEIRIPKGMKAASGMFMRYPVHGRSSMRNVRVVGRSAGPWIEASTYDLIDCCDGDSDGDLVYFIPNFTLEWDTIPGAGGVKAKAKDGQIEAQEYDTLERAAFAKAKASAQIGIAVDAAYVFMQHERKGAEMTKLFAHWMEETASIAAKDGAAAPKWGSKNVEQVREGLIGDSNYHCPWTALLKALCSRKHRLATTCEWGRGFTTYGCLEVRKENDSKRELGRLAQLLASLNHIQHCPWNGHAVVKHLKYMGKLTMERVQRTAPETMCKRMVDVYRQSAQLVREASPHASIALAKARLAFAKAPAGEKETAVKQSLRKSWVEAPYTVKALAYAMAATYQDPYALHAAGLGVKAVWTSTAFVNAVWEATDHKVGLPGADYDPTIKVINTPQIGVDGDQYQFGLVKLERRNGNPGPYILVDEDKDIIWDYGQDPITGLWLSPDESWIKKRISIQF